MAKIVAIIVAFCLVFPPSAVFAAEVECPPSGQSRIELLKQHQEDLNNMVPATPKEFDIFDRCIEALNQVRQMWEKLNVSDDLWENIANAVHKAWQSARDAFVQVLAGAACMIVTEPIENAVTQVEAIESYLNGASTASDLGSRIGQTQAQRVVNLTKNNTTSSWSSGSTISPSRLTNMSGVTSLNP